MRKTVYKGEFFEIKQKIDSDIYEVFENKIFKETHNDRNNKLLFLKDSIYSRRELNEQLSSISGLDSAVVKEIINVLIINDDLLIPEKLKQAILKGNVVLFELVFQQV